MFNPCSSVAKHLPSIVKALLALSLALSLVLAVALEPVVAWLGKVGKDKTTTMFSSLVPAMLNLLIGNEYSKTRKIKEAILAVEATRTFSKSQILEMYFNQIYFGEGAHGVEAAAKTSSALVLSPHRSR